MTVLTFKRLLLMNLNKKKRLTCRLRDSKKKTALELS